MLTNTSLGGTILNRYHSSEYGIILANEDQKILGFNQTAEAIINNPAIINSHVNSILPKIGLDYTVEKTEFFKPAKDFGNTKYAYLIRPKSTKNEDFYKTILESSHDEIFVTDGEGTTLYCNKAFEKNYGMKRSEIIGKTVWHLSNNGYCSQSPIPIVIDKKKQITIDQKTSTGRKLVITATPVFNASGEIDIIVENCRDITEIDKIKYNLEKTKKQMELYKTEVENLRKKELNLKDELIYKSKKLKKIIDTIHRVSNIDATILLLGESGTGKTVIAKYIHKNSSRRNGPFITINCATISPSLFESELFGYVPGAFTGAHKNGKIGLVELANKGTLFLDEVGEIPLSLQSKLLELIQEHSFTPVGGIAPKLVDTRIISATNKNLSELVKDKFFREDLYYRLKVIDLYIPSLRERPDDLEALISYFLIKYNNKYNMNHEFSRESINILVKYPWPGNIRELQHIIEQIVITIPNKCIEPHDLPVYIYSNFISYSDSDSKELPLLDEALEEVQKTIILKAYNDLKSSYKVAKVLGISQSRANRIIRKYTSKIDSDTYI
jgi:PAS domain S-box-containing protein